MRNKRTIFFLRFFVSRFLIPFRSTFLPTISYLLTVLPLFPFLPSRFTSLYFPFIVYLAQYNLLLFSLPFLSIIFLSSFCYLYIVFVVVFSTFSMFSLLFRILFFLISQLRRFFSSFQPINPPILYLKFSSLSHPMILLFIVVYFISII